MWSYWGNNWLWWFFLYNPSIYHVPKLHFIMKFVVCVYMVVIAAWYDVQPSFCEKQSGYRKAEIRKWTPFGILLKSQGLQISPTPPVFDSLFILIHLFGWPRTQSPISFGSEPVSQLPRLIWVFALCSTKDTFWKGGTKSLCYMFELYSRYECASTRSM